MTRRRTDRHRLGIQAAEQLLEAGVLEAAAVARVNIFWSRAAPRPVSPQVTSTPSALAAAPSRTLTIPYSRDAVSAEA